MGAIISKEIKSFFNNMLGYVFCAVIIILIGIYFLANNLSYGYPYFAWALRGATTIMVFTLPLLTMRSFAEETKNKSDQLLLTAPISVTRIVLGKFIAYAIIFAIPMIIACFCPLIIKALGTAAYLKVDYLTILTTYVFGLMIIAIGLFISSITESQIISAVISFIVVFLIALWSAITGMIPDTAVASLIGMIVIIALVCAIIYAISKSSTITILIGIVATVVTVVFFFANSTGLQSFFSSIIDALTLTTPLSNVAYYEIFDLGGLIMYISIGFCFIVFTVNSIQKRRWS